MVDLYDMLKNPESYQLTQEGTPSAVGRGDLKKEENAWRFIGLNALERFLPVAGVSLSVKVGMVMGDKWDQPYAMGLFNNLKHMHISKLQQVSRKFLLKEVLF